MPINGRMDKLTVVYSYNRILVSNKQTTDVCNTMDESCRTRLGERNQAGKTKQSKINEQAHCLTAVTWSSRTSKINIQC